MASFTLCYDLERTNNPNNAFIEAALGLGWKAWVRGTDSKWHKLPDTTLRGDFANKDAAIKAFEAIKPAAEKILGKTLKIEKYFLVESSTISMFSDETKSENPYP